MEDGQPNTDMCGQRGGEGQKCPKICGHPLYMASFLPEKQNLKWKISALVQHSQSNEFKYKNERTVTNNTLSKTENY